MPDDKTFSPLEKQCINTIRTLAIDGVERAQSGHPGTPMALAAPAFLLWTRFLRFNPRSPSWFDRDRFVLSNGHASMLLYALLHLTGYDLTLDDLRNFRQLGSRTPGHPEHGVTPGVETTTGPLGQGFMNAVGMAIAESHLAAVYNRPGHTIVDHHTYCFCGDGDLMEGGSYEAASLAGHLGLGKLIVLYDDNRITIEGTTGLSFSENVGDRFRACGWHVQDIGDTAEEPGPLENAIAAAKSEEERPSLIILRTHIGYGSPGRQDTKEAHGEPLGTEEARLAKRFYGWPEDAAFLVPEEVAGFMAQAGEAGAAKEDEWLGRWESYRQEHPPLAAELALRISGELPEGWDDGLPAFNPADGPLATRAAAGKVLNALAKKVPALVGGSGDLAPSTKTLLSGTGYFSRTDRAGRNIAWGIREHAMCACSSGMALHGGIRPFAATFFTFTDYARPAIRLAALMELPVVYVMTHDSIGLGEDGPTHQPVEHLASLRAMPGIRTIRPSDANETAWAWRAALTLPGPTILVLSRQNLPVFDRTVCAPAENLLRGAYVLLREKGTSPHVILIATGSEVRPAAEAREKLAEQGVDVRVVSMPCWELFREQPPQYRDEVLPPHVKARLSVEAASPMGWREWVGDQGDCVAMTSFGTSAPEADAYRSFGFTVDEIVRRAVALV